VCKDALAIMANVHCGALIFTGHAFSRMFARAITPAEVRAVVDHLSEEVALKVYAVADLAVRSGAEVEILRFAA